MGVSNITLSFTKFRRRFNLSRNPTLIVAASIAKHLVNLSQRLSARLRDQDQGPHTRKDTPHCRSTLEQPIDTGWQRNTL
ncbi:hypothetical protein VI817_001471 [Penicillium citrinum]|nr:hypothetical protein VI817_001471 [Penicillium citrinum]